MSNLSTGIPKIDRKIKSLRNKGEKKYDAANKIDKEIDRLRDCISKLKLKSNILWDKGDQLHDQADNLYAKHR